jgi:plastocyanin
MKTRLLVTMTAFAAATLFVGLDAGSARAAGEIKGKISFEGTPPQRRPIKMSADPKCEAANPDGRLGDVFIINDGAVENVFVYVKEGLSGEFEVPKEPATIDQHGCMYSPHVIGAMVGQTIEIHNSDTTLHNVHSLPENSKQFNNAMPMKGMTIKKKFTAPEVMVRMKCDVHPWMSAFVGVVSHPFFAVSGADGMFTISGLPAGTYTIEAWHEKMGTQTQQVTVPDGGAATADFSFKLEG